MCSSGEGKEQKEIYTSYIKENQSHFTERLTKNLQSMVFENRFTMHPRQIRKLGAEEIESVLKYFEDGENTAVRERGKVKARKGFGEQSVLTLGKTLTEVFLDGNDQLDIDLIKGAIEVVDEYMSSYISGFIEGRETFILEEQERLRKAYTTVEKKRKGEK